MNPSRTNTDSASLVTLIAWLSTCMLASGLGMMADPTMHSLWLRMGAFGLVAAAGLEGAARTRARRARIKCERKLTKRCERNLRQYTAERDSLAERKTAVACLLASQAHPPREVGDRRGEPRWSCDLAVEIVPVRRESDATYSATASPAVRGRLANLSNSGFGVELEAKSTGRLVVISFEPPFEQTFDLLAELLWCDSNADGKIRGGGRLLHILPKCVLDDTQLAMKLEQARAVTGF
jgi:hypothetical protein